jgi:hypothetical protein
VKAKKQSARPNFVEFSVKSAKFQSKFSGIRRNIVLKAVFSLATPKRPYRQSRFQTHHAARQQPAANF